MTKECEKDQNQITQQIMREKSDTCKYLDEFNEEFLKTFSDQASKITYMVEYQEQK